MVFLMLLTAYAGSYGQSATMKYSAEDLSKETLSLFEDKAQLKQFIAHLNEIDSCKKKLAGADVCERINRMLQEMNELLVKPTIDESINEIVQRKRDMLQQQYNCLVDYARHYLNELEIE